jgi:hypothetical protein
MDIISKIERVKEVRFFCLGFVLFSLVTTVQAQYVEAQGKRIVDQEGNELVLRGIGLGGWMLQEGYMLRTWGAQYELENRIEELIGAEKKEEFYAAWLANHCTKRDIDSLAAWGFNSVRLPMHYKLFTPPIEEEPVQGEITWLNEGFEMVDDLLSWLKANDMYLILDLHAAPGGQGENADISDYDPSKPSLWESDDNKDKMVALWGKLAERYANEPNIAGYDLINETNWGFDNNHQTDINGCNQSTNAPLWEIQKRCIEAIRAVDQNHMIIIEGNCWGNNYNGLPDNLWDDNITISYHKYWNSNDQGSLAPLLETQNKWNVPLWLGETGENSNAWFSDAIELLEDNHIGWSWWPQKKMGGNNVQEIEINQGYQDILDYWGGNGEKPSETEAYASLMGIAENLKAQNNTYHVDVVDAMTRQPYEKTAIPFKEHLIKESEMYRLFFTDYDLGNQGIAYEDEEYTNETGQPGGSAWNIGGRYRNDGVDIEACEDEISNGFNVGWTRDREWMQYSVQVETSGAYQLSVKYAGTSDGIIKVLVDGDDMTGHITLPASGGYQNWSSINIEDVILEQGSNVIQFYIVKGAANLNYLDVIKTKNVEELPFESVSATSSESGKEILLNVNKDIDASSISKSNFNIEIDGSNASITSVELSAESSKMLILSIEDDILYESVIKLSYSGDEIVSVVGQTLNQIIDLNVDRGLPIHYVIPSKIYAYDFFNMKGMVVLKNENDPGSEYHLGYTDAGDFSEYYLSVPNTGDYYIQARGANNNGTPGKIEFEQISLDGEVLNTVSLDIPSTGGWEKWQTTPAVHWKLEAGRSVLKMKIIKSGINLTWFVMSERVLDVDEKKNNFEAFPNPTGSILNIDLPMDFGQINKLTFWNLEGQIVHEKNISSNMKRLAVDVSKFGEGIYILELITNESKSHKRIMIKK